MVSMVMSFEGEVLIPQHQSFSPVPATAAGLHSTMPVLTAATGRQFRTRTTTSRGTSTSIRVATTRATSTATAGGLFALSKGFKIRTREDYVMSDEYEITGIIVKKKESNDGCAGCIGALFLGVILGACSESCC